MVRCRTCLAWNEPDWTCRRLAPRPGVENMLAAKWRKVHPDEDWCVEHIPAGPGNVVPLVKRRGNPNGFKRVAK